MSQENDRRKRTRELVCSRKMGAGKHRRPYTPCLHPSYDLVGQATLQTIAINSAISMCREGHSNNERQRMTFNLLPRFVLVIARAMRLFMISFGARRPASGPRSSSEYRGFRILVRRWELL